MELRDELLPPAFDESVVARLAALADRIDGGRPELADEDLAEFHRLSGTDIPYDEFQGISGGEDPIEWVRRILIQRQVRRVDLSREEMIEIVTRALSDGPGRDFYIELFRANCRHPSTTDLLFWPSSVEGLPKGREPTVEEIADLALA